MEYRLGAKTDFFKLYYAVPKITPPSRIYLYYYGRPLYCPAVFETDRYAFALPKNLEEKMLAGDLIADFAYAAVPRGMFYAGKRVRIPESIVLSDRYA